MVSISITPRIFLVFHGDFLPILEYMSCIKFYLCIRDKIKNPHGVIGLMQYISVSQNLFNGILLLWDINGHNEKKEFYDQNLGWVGEVKGLNREGTHR